MSSLGTTPRPGIEATEIPERFDSVEGNGEIKIYDREYHDRVWIQSDTFMSLGR